MNNRSSIPALLAFALAGYPHLIETPYDRFVPNELPPHDPNFRIKKPAKSWGRKSKKRKG